MTVAIYHEMRRRDSFEQTAGKLWVMIRRAASVSPGAPRELYMDIEGHTRKGDRSRYDSDATEIINFIRVALGPYLTETSWGRNGDVSQSEDFPDVIIIPHISRDDVVWALTGDAELPVKLMSVDELNDVERVRIRER